MKQSLPEIDEKLTTNSIQINTEGKNVVHFAALPNGTTIVEPVKFPDEPILEYDFKLDEFQRESIACIHNRESVLVSAHTSAGKTAIAFYAIKMALQSGSRVVYTSPIKALSNQKYRELKERFDDVGLMTGDVTTNPNASVLVMTTEILRMMLYRGDNLTRELSWVIYDEIHYMRDVERGVVWEESIILLPHEIRFVFLSATIPNSREFSEWISRIHHQTCHVVYTEYRPVPLRYYLALPERDPILVKEADSPINENSFNAAFEFLSAGENGGGLAPENNRQTFSGALVHQIKPKKLPGKGNASKEINAKCTSKIVQNLVKLDLAPLIVFAFGRKECDELPNSPALKDACFIAEEDSNFIDSCVNVCIDKLSESDRQLPQIETVRQLLLRGIAVHHGGLIPLMKELIEVLFQKGYVKVLIATETFAMGLNMPARTVLFHSLIKFDGLQRRILSGGEFIQMSGRAGRRNNDTFGAVVISLNGDLDHDQVHDLLECDAQPLNSEFHITYHMILSLLSTKQMKPEDLMSQSFHQFQMEREIPQLIKSIDDKEAELKQLVETIGDDSRIRMRVEIDEMINHYTDAEKEMVSKIENIGERLIPGIPVEVDDGWGWGFVIRSPSKNTKSIIVALKGIQDPNSKEIKQVTPSDPISSIKGFVFNVSLTDIKTVGSIKINMLSDPTSSQNIANGFKQIDNQMRRPNGIQSLPRSELICLQDDIPKYKTYVTYINDLKKRKPDFNDITDSQIELYLKKRDLVHQIRDFNLKKSQLTSEVDQTKLQSMERVLEKLNFADSSGLITHKGEVAAVITAGDEIVMTEMLFDGLLSGPDITPQKIAAILCIFACDEGLKEEPEIPDEMEELWEKTKAIVERVVTVMNECGLDVKLDNYMKKIDPTYMVLTFNWAGGAEFSKLMQDNDNFFEGSIIRSMKRTEEIMRQAERAAKVMGNSDLEVNISQAISAIKRDIIFAASLYL